jgi:hypothetical protein
MIVRGIACAPTVRWFKTGSFVAMAAVTGAIVIGLAAGSAGAAGTLTVAGQLVVAAKLDAPPSGANGFLPPVENPIQDLRPFDPLPECFVFLDGGPGAGDASTPPKSAIIWQLGTHSFSPSVLPVVAGAAVEIDNVGRETHILYSPDQPELVAKDPIGPSGSKTITTPSGVQVITLRSRSSPHLEGRLVIVPTRFFARVDRAGKFKLENVPPGHYTLRVWFRDGWLKLDKAIDLPAKEKDMKIEITASQIAERLASAANPAPAPSAPASAPAPVSPNPSGK